MIGQGLDMREKVHAEDIRTEYTALLTYFNFLVNTRFIIAGLYITGNGFIVSTLAKGDILMFFRIAGSVLAIWMTLCIWILELRSRCLFKNLAMRGIEIEHDEWELKGHRWYSGFFSRQYKIPPNKDEDKTNVQDEKPPPDCPSLIFLPKFPPNVSKYITHRLGLDFLYAGGIIFWLFILFYSLQNQ